MKRNSQSWPSKMSDELTAYHESGHAFMALYLGARVRSLSIEPGYEADRYGDTQIEWPLPPETNKATITKAVLVALAGPVAEMIHTGEPFHPAFVAEWSSDWQMAWEAASRIFPDKQACLAFLEQTTRQLYETLSRDDHWAALSAIMDHLLAHENLEREMIQEVYDAWM